MCGIVGYAGSDFAVEKLHLGLKRLEYRGYDSAGISFFCGEKLQTIKNVGSVDCLFEKVNREFFNASNEAKACKKGKANKNAIKNTAECFEQIFVGIGHTRWATHGKATENNSHPHQSAFKTISLVHNGIIENYQELKEQFLKGVPLASETDTEIVANLIEQAMFEQPLIENAPPEHIPLELVTNKDYMPKNKADYPSKSNLGLNEQVLTDCIDCKNDNVCKKLCAIKSATNKLKGSFALAILFLDDPHRIYFAKQVSPLLIGTSEFGNFLASDILGFDSEVHEYIEVLDGQFGYISRGDVQIFDKNGKKLNISAKKLNSQQKSANLGSFPHYMLKEINEIPKSIKNTANLYLSQNSPLKKTFVLSKKSQNEKISKLFDGIERIHLVACGTSFHASKVGELWLKNLGFDATADVASEFIYSPQVLNKNTICIFTSQSGETADTLAAVRLAKKYHAKTIGITNVETSTLAKICDLILPIKCGAEIAVASTKAYNSQLCVLKILTEFLKQEKSIKKLAKNKTSQKYNIISTKIEILQKNQQKVQKNIKKLQKNIKKLQNLANFVDISKFKESVKNLTGLVLNAKNIFMVGKNFDYVLAMESALKLKEISYLNAEAYPSGELKHGTISLVDNNSLIFAFATEKALLSKTMNIVEQVHSRGATVVLASPYDELSKNEAVSHFLKLPQIDEKLYPIISIIPMQLLAYNVSVALGNNPDKPRNLAKSVTVE